MSRVIISSGHTDKNPGSVVAELREVDLARAIAVKISPKLRQAGIITLTSPANIEPEKRVEWVNNSGYRSELDDVLVEIHINEGGKTGFEVWYSSIPGKESKILADSISRRIESEVKLKNQGTHDQTEHSLGGIALMQNINPRSVIVECLYIDNEKDQEFLRSDDRLIKLSNSIAAGIIDYFQKNSPQAPLDGDSAVSNGQTNKEENDNDDKGGGSSSNKNDADSDGRSIEDSDELSDEDSRGGSDGDKHATPLNTAGDSNHSTNVSKTSPGGQSDNSGNSNTSIANAGGNSKGGSGNSDNKSSNFNGTFDNSGSFGGGNDFSGGFGGSNTGGFGSNAGGFGGSSSAGLGSQKQMSRDERKEMIIKYFKKAFGQEPKDSDINYFLNIGISEEQLLKRIMDSEDHKKQVENANKYQELKEKYDKLETKAFNLENKLKDQNRIMTSLRDLLDQKNLFLSQLQKQNQNLIHKIEERQSGKRPEKAKVDYKPTTLEKILKYFSSRLGG